MIILGVDSSGPVAGVALARDGRVLAESAANLGLTHSQTLQPMIASIMDLARLTARDVDLFACVAGPGSFTGVRIGVCAVKAMAQATGKPCVGLNALEVLAAGQFGFQGVICPILDARRGQVYGAAFRFASGDMPERVMEDRAMALGEFAALLPQGEPLLFVGDGCAVHGAAVTAQIGARARIAPDFRAQLRVGAACHLAQWKAPGDYLSLEPIYLRAPQAERERAQRAGRASDA